MKRYGLLALVSVFLLAACFGTGNAVSYRTVFGQPQYDWAGSTGETLTVWTKAGELNRVYMQRALEQYEETTKNTLHIVEIPAEEFEEQTAAAFAGQGEAPDILVSYGGTNIERYNPDENFYDFTKAPWVVDLTSTSINQTIYHGRVIGLPHWEASISGTLYNKKLFEKYKIPLPDSQESFLAACETLLQNGVTPVYLPYAEISMLLYQFPLDALVEDRKTLDALNAGTIGYDNLPGMETVLEWYRTMARRGYFGQNYQANDWNGMNEAMKSEKYAMMLCWDTWLYTDFDGDASQFGLMPAFMGVPDQGTFEGPNLALLIVNQHSPRVDAAVDFITFMADPYNYNRAFEGIYTAPVFRNQAASISTPQYVESERLIEQRFRDSTAWLRIRGFSQMDAVCIQRYMDGGDEITPEQCLKEMDALRQARF